MPARFATAPPTRSYDESLRLARSGPVFAGDAARDAWTQRWCGTCVNDGGGRTPRCPLLLIARHGRIPIEWTERWGSHVSADSTYHCHYYEPDLRSWELPP
jgi:hypothetical protein